jgi:hypothetical protein
MDGTGSGVSEQGIGKINWYRKNSIKEELMATTMLTWSAGAQRPSRYSGAAFYALLNAVALITSKQGVEA